MTTRSDRKARTKYGATRCEYKGIKFDSKLDRALYQKYELLKLAGEIETFGYHGDPVELLPGVTYEPDLWYTVVVTGGKRLFYVEAKGGHYSKRQMLSKHKTPKLLPRKWHDNGTPEWRLKMKLLLRMYPDFPLRIEYGRVSQSTGQFVTTRTGTLQEIFGKKSTPAKPMTAAGARER